MVDATPERTPPTNIESTKSIQPAQEQQPEPGESFKSYMDEGRQTGQTSGKPDEASPFDLAKQGSMGIANPSMDTLMGQMNSTSSVLGDVQKQLHTKNLNLKQSHKYLLRNKLTSANQNIRVAADKSGVKLGEPPTTSARQTPVTKFLGLLTDGQEQLNKTQEMIQNMKLSGGSLSPGTLLTIQVKLAKAQQELEYSSILLSKAVEDIKTMFNIQL